MAGDDQKEKMEGRHMGKTTFWTAVSTLDNFAPRPGSDSPENIRECLVIATGGRGGATGLQGCC